MLFIYLGLRLGSRVHRHFRVLTKVLKCFLVGFRHLRQRVLVRFCMGGHFIIVTKSYLSLAKSLGFVIVEANLCKDRKTNLPFHSSKMLWWLPATQFFAFLSIGCARFWNTYTMKTRNPDLTRYDLLGRKRSVCSLQLNYQRAKEKVIVESWFALSLLKPFLPLSQHVI